MAHSLPRDGKNGQDAIVSDSGLAESLIVAFSGPDGSGKTTLATKLVRQLGENGFRAKYVWCRHESMIVHTLVNIARFIGEDASGKSSKEDSYGSFKSRILSKELPKKIYSLFVLVDYLIEVNRRIVRKLGDVDILVVDRYVIDVAVDVSVECNLSRGQSGRYLELLRRLTPTPAVTFLVLVPAIVSLERKADIPTPEYVERRLTVFQNHLQDYGIVPLDGLEPTDTILQRVTGAVTSACRRRQRERD